MRNIHYIVALYLGKRRNMDLNKALSDPFHLVNMHLQALSNLSIPLVKKATFVISPSGNKHRDDMVANFIKNQKIQGIELDSYITTKSFFWSYSSWDDCMTMSIEDDMDFFLIEDDYLPAKDEFYMPFVEKKNDGVAYISQFCTIVEGDRYRASISNGLMNHDAAKSHHQALGACLHLPVLKGKVGNPGVAGQIYFLDKFKDLGYSVKDVSDGYHQPFLNARNKVVSFGNPNGEILIKPYNL